MNITKNLKKTNNNILIKKIVIIICTVPNDEKSTYLSIAKTLITNKLAACVTILPNIHSIYYWNNQIQKQEEIQLLIKTCTTLEKSVFQHIKNKHPYQIPELLTLKITNGEPNYLSWIYNLLH